VISKFLQKIFKIVSYNLFFILYGKITKPLVESIDTRIIIETVNIEKDLIYKVYKIKEGRLYTDRVHDTAIMLDNKIMNGPSFQYRYTKDSYTNVYNSSYTKIYNSNVKDNVVFKIGTPRILSNLNGVVLSLLSGGAGNSNYWHWLFDVLPRIALCNKVINLKDVDYFLLPDDIKKFQYETLDCLNISKNKRLSSVKYRHIKAKELIVTDHPFVTTGVATEDIMNIPKWISTWLKDNFLKKNIISNEKIGKKIYIDRDDATSKKTLERSIINEYEVKKYLLRNNFIPVKLHEIKFIEQVNLFYNASCVVGLHGGGFANLPFCKPGTKVIELKGNNAGTAIENLAKKNNLNYGSISVKPKQIDKVNFPSQQGHIEISINELKKILEE
jgi:capsular polysaccharide biosynthesis protein